MKLCNLPFFPRAGFIRAVNIGLLTLLSACNDNGDLTVNISEEELSNTPGVSLPLKVRNTRALDLSRISATISVDGGTPRTMTINDSTARISLPSLSAGTHTFHTIFYYNSPQYGLITVSDAQKTYQVQANTTTQVSFVEADYHYPDNDNDNHPNIDELNNGTDPEDQNDPTPSDDDSYEENDSLTTAYDLSSYEDEVISDIAGNGIQKDDDWFKIEAKSGTERVLAGATFSHAEGDINIALYNTSGTLLASSTSSEDTEIIDFTVSTSGTYYLRVYGQNAGNSYNLGWDDVEPQPEDDDTYEENDNSSTAYDLSGSEQTWLSSISGEGVQLDEDWYRIDATHGYQRIQIDVRFTDVDGDIDIGLYDNSGNLLAYSNSANDNEFIDYTVATSYEYYYIRVMGNLIETGNTYDLWWDDLATDNDSSLSTDLSPFEKTGWDDAIVLRNDMGCGDTDCQHTALLSSDTVYASWAVINTGADAAAEIENLEVRIYVDDQLEFTGTISSDVTSYISWWWLNLELGSFAAGTHTLKMIIDEPDVVSESYNNNNIRTYTFTVDP